MKKDVDKIINNIIRIMLVITLIVNFNSVSGKEFGMLVVTFFLTFYDYIVSKIFKLSMNNKIFISLFIFFSQYLGSCLGFYDKFFWWDIMLHTLSGVLFYLIGMDIYKAIYKDKNGLLMFLFAFLFSLSIANLWEIWEYLWDGLLGLDTQRSYLLIGRYALKDTMTDLISSTI